jgi:porphyrinogen peroxidase
MMPQEVAEIRPIPQAVTATLTPAAIFLVVTIKPGLDNCASVRALCSDLATLVRAVGFRDSDAALSCVVGFGSGAWDRLFGHPRPAGLHPFREIRSGPRHAISTPGDVLFHIRAQRMDLCFELATQIMEACAGAACPVDEVHGFRYFDARDLLGFVDGTENPNGLAAERAVAVTAADDPDFVGSSYVIVQKYLHDIPAWNAIPVEEQERAIGRSKLADIEMLDDVKPANSHVALNTVTGPDGEERQIVRANMAFGEIGRGEFGTYFIGYAASVSVTEQMLTNMFIGQPPGNTDRILDFSTAVTGTLFFAPSADFLDDPPPAPAALTAANAAAPATSGATGTTAAPSPATSPDSGAAANGRGAAPGSLGIGSLKGRP